MSTVKTKNLVIALYLNKLWWDGPKIYRNYYYLNLLKTILIGTNSLKMSKVHVLLSKSKL